MYSQNPPTIEEMTMIRRALSLALEEIHHPGSARASNIDLLGNIDSAIYCLTDAIERPQAA